MSDDQVFEALGFQWDRSLVPTAVPVHSIERAAFRLHKSLPEFVDKLTSDHLHAIIARDEAFDAGRFRGEGTEQQLTPGVVSLGEFGHYLPPETEPGGGNLRDLHTRGLQVITGRLPGPYEQAVVYFLFGALRQFYFHGNKRTARYMMDGHLMSHGIDAISVPARRAREFNTLMVDFYRFRDTSRMVAFLTDCHPDADQLMTPTLRSLLG